jgi:alkylated DNA nucleotide flippase Atl1
MHEKKTCREKLTDCKDLPRVEEIPKKMRKAWGSGTLVIPSPREVDEIMRKIPKGKLTTINHIRSALARKHGTTIGCPITTGLFARIAAGAAAEDEAEGRKHITPFWRTLKSRGELNPKYPGGIQGQRRRLQSECHKVITRGKRTFVEDYENSVVQL